MNLNGAARPQNAITVTRRDPRVTQGEPGVNAATHQDGPAAVQKPHEGDLKGRWWSKFGREEGTEAKFRPWVGRQRRRFGWSSGASPVNRVPTVKP